MPETRIRETIEESIGVHYKELSQWLYDPQNLCGWTTMHFGQS